MKKIKINSLTNDIYYGSNFSKDISEILKMKLWQYKNIILFTGKNFFKNSVYYDRLLKIINKNNLNISLQVSVESNPKLIEIENINKQITNKDATLFLVVGGGSVLDFAKACKLYSLSDVQIFSIYTTLGSASIVSPFTVYDNDEFKIGDYSEKIIPELVYINTEIVSSVPKIFLNAGIVDIFGHAVESYYSKVANETTRKNAFNSLVFLNEFITGGKIINLIFSDIYAGLSEREAIILIPHALGHFITHKYKITHGYANYMFMEDFLNLLRKNNIKIEDIILEVMLKLPEFKIKEFISAELSESDLVLIKKYMGFAFDNCPFAFLENNDIIKLYSNSIKKYVGPTKQSY